MVVPNGALVNGVLWSGFGGGWYQMLPVQVGRSWDLGKTWVWCTQSLGSGAWPYSITSPAVTLFKDKLVMAGGQSPYVIGLNAVWTSTDGVAWQAAPTPSWHGRDYATLVTVSGPCHIGDCLWAFYLVTGQHNYVSSIRFRDVWTSDPTGTAGRQKCIADLPTAGRLYLADAAAATDTVVSSCGRIVCTSATLPVMLR